VNCGKRVGRTLTPGLTTPRTALITTSSRKKGASSGQILIY
jgi:hypothetical protein